MFYRSTKRIGLSTNTEETPKTGTDAVWTGATYWLQLSFTLFMLIKFGLDSNPPVKMDRAQRLSGFPCGKHGFGSVMHHACNLAWGLNTKRVNSYVTASSPEGLQSIQGITNPQRRNKYALDSSLGYLDISMTYATMY